MLMKALTVAASVAVLAAPLSSYAGDSNRHRDGVIRSAQADGIGKQTSPPNAVGVYEGTLHPADGDRSGLKRAHFKYSYTDGSAVGGTPSEQCYLASFTLDVHRDNDKWGQKGNLHLKGSGLDCSAGGLGNGESIQNFVYYVVDADGCFSSWKQHDGSGNIASDTVYKGKNPKSIIHLDGNIVTSEFDD
jgi:hypothetical protein